MIIQKAVSFFIKSLLNSYFSCRMIVAWKVYKIVSNQNYLVSFSCYFSMTNLENFINANENKGRDYSCGAEGANNDDFVVNLSGKSTLVGRASGESFI
jgi:hypothetical protein